MNGQHVVVVTEGDISKVQHNIETGPGSYALGSGDTGAAKAFVAMRAMYGAMGLLGSRFMILPNSNWTPTGPVVEASKFEKDNDGDNSAASTPPTAAGAAAAAANTNDIGLPASYVTSSTTQYPLLWLSVFGNATGGLALLSSSKLIASAVVGPMGLGYMRSYSISNAIQDLLGKIEEGDGFFNSTSTSGAATAFEQTFGCTLQDTDTDTIQRLIEAKTIFIGWLMELMPEGTVADPTPFIYDTTCYAAAGLMGVGLLANLAIDSTLGFCKDSGRIGKEGKINEYCR